MQNLSAQVTSEFLQFPDATVKALQEDDIQLDSVLRAKFTPGKAGLAWLACGPQLEVTNALTGERLSAYHFSGVTERPPTVVTVKEFTWQKKTGLLVGLVEAESSVLCLYDVSISRVVKAVVLPGSTLYFLKNSGSSLNETIPDGYSRCLVAGLLSPRLADVQPSSLSQNSLDCILHPAASRVMSWQHNQIIETLLCQGDYRQALRYIQVMKPPAFTSAEVKLQITVLLANKPKPLSTMVKQAPAGSVTSKATFISNVLMKIKEVSATDVKMDFSPYKSLTVEEQNPSTTQPHLEVTDAFISTPISKARSAPRFLDPIIHPLLTEALPLDTDFEMVSERTPRRSTMLATSSPVQSSLRKIAQLRNLTRASEFNLLETPIVVKDIKEKELSELEPIMTISSQLHQADELQEDYNADNVKDHYKCEHPDDKTVGSDDAEVENTVAASNFTLILEEDEAGEDEAAVDKMLESGNAADQELTAVSKQSFSLPEENPNQEIKTTDACPANAFTLVDGERETKIMETLPYVPEPIKVAVEENVVDVFKGASSKEFTSDGVGESAQVNEPVKNRRGVHPRTPSKRRETKPEAVGNESIIRAVTPQKKMDVGKLLESLETSPKEDASTAANPQTPRRTVRRSTRTTESTSSADLEVQLPVTPRRGRKPKVQEEKPTLSTTQEGQSSSQIFTRKRSQVPEKTQNTDVDSAVVEEVTVQVPLSPGRTRRSKAAVLDQGNKGNEDVLDPKIGVLTPTRITRSSKNLQEAEKEPSTKSSETENEQVTTPTRGRRGKRAVNELVKQFELSAAQPSYKEDSSPPVSPKRVALRWSRLKSEDQADQQTAEDEIAQSHEQNVDTPRKILRRSKVSKLGEESTEPSENVPLVEQADEPAVTKATKKENLSIRQIRKRNLPAVPEETVEERLHSSQSLDSQDTAPNTDVEEQTKSVRITRNRQNASSFLDASMATFAFTTPTPRRRKNAKVEPVAPSVSPIHALESVQPPVSPQYIFSPPSLRTRRTTRNTTTVTEKEQEPKIPESEDKQIEVPEEHIVKRPRGRPPKHKGNKAEKPVDKASWSPPTVEIQLLSPPESPDVESAKIASMETKAMDQNELKKNRRRIVSKPVTRRKIR
uniref:ELYS protein n=1 Tax=Pyxicephalus adspersus TaxID=30357 RepID=A0AAV3A703_PYXAD|nr:TPA: hypothetical protein GDO54_011120 [Pyxicephalus adspersus]